MAYADEQSYEEMISVLQNYVSQVEEECGVMESAGTDCVDNTDNDPAAVTSNSKLQQCIGKIRGAAKSIQQIIAALQQELEDIRETAAKANQMD